MYRTPVIIGKIIPDRVNRTPTRSRGVLLRPEALSRLLHGYLPKRKNNFTLCVFLQIYLLPFVVLISRELVCQRRWRILATEYAGVDILLDYLPSETVTDRAVWHSGECRGGRGLSWVLWAGRPIREKISEFIPEIWVSISHTLFCNQISYSDVKKCAWFEIKQIYLYFLYLIVCLQKFKGSNDSNRLNRVFGVFGVAGSWKLEAI